MPRRTTSRLTDAFVRSLKPRASGLIGRVSDAWPKPEKEPHASALLSNTMVGAVCMADFQLALKRTTG